MLAGLCLVCQVSNCVMAKASAAAAAAVAKAAAGVVAAVAAAARSPMCPGRHCSVTVPGGPPVRRQQRSLARPA